MTDNKAKSRLVLIMVILLFFLLLLIITLLGALEKDTTSAANSVVTNQIVDNLTEVKDKPDTIESIIAKYKSQYISKDGNTIYLKLGKDLYSDNGESNEKYFESFVYDLSQFFLTATFNLVDEEKNVTVTAEYDFNTEKHIIRYNNREEFFENTDGKSYIAVQTSEIVEPAVVFKADGFLRELILGSMYISSVEDEFLTEYRVLDSGYRYYENENLKIKLAPNDSVFNMVLMGGYHGNIFHDVPFGTPLNRVYELHPDNTFGSVGEKYLGYRNNDYYYFFYNDEVSLYGYLYAENKDFERALKKYIETKDLETFYKKAKKILAYDALNYDPESQSLYMNFPTRGMEIDIQNNDPKGITLYNNYCFTDDSRQLVKDGYISYRDVDAVLKYEKERRSGN